MKITENGQTANETNTAKNESKAGENTSAVKASLSDISVKGLLGEKDVQEAMRRHVAIPEVVTVKKVRNPFKNEETKVTTQKIEALTGTTIENATSIEFVLFDTELDPVKAVNKKFRIMDYTLALEANMRSGTFNGYAAKGMKLQVSRLEEVKGAENK